MTSYRDSMLPRVVATLCCALLSLAGPATAQAGVEPFDDNVIELDMAAESLTLLDNDRALLVGKEEGRLALIELDSGKVLREIRYGERFGEGAFSDVALSPGADAAYFVGQDQKEGGILVRLRLGSWHTDVIRFWDSFRAPSVAVTASGSVLIGDLNSNTITVIEEFWFEKLSGERIGRADFGRNIYLENGPAVELGVSPDGRFITVSHANEPTVSLIDAEYSEKVDGVGLDAPRPYPLSMVLVTPRAGRGGEPTTSVVIGELEEDVLMIADIDRSFQKFGRTETTGLGLNSQVGKGGDFNSPMLLSSSADRRVIMVGSRTGSKAVVFSRQQRTLEGPYFVEIGEHPRDIDVSSDGRLATILRSNGRSLRVVRNPLDWSKQTNLVSRSAPIEEAQRMLAALRYPVGVVDGVIGPRTKRAIQEFQRSAGLHASGIVDDGTLERIRSVVAETSSCRPVEEAMRCYNRITSRRFSVYPVDETTLESICAAPKGSDLPVQIDRFNTKSARRLASLARKRPKYLAEAYTCTTSHSCPYIRYRDVFAYDTICRRDVPSSVQKGEAGIAG